MGLQLVYEDLNSFVRNQDPVKSLGLGYEGKIRNFFRQYDVPDEDYEVKEDGEIIFNTDLYLAYTNISELPDNLTVNGWLTIENTNITKLPNNLSVNKWLGLKQTKITELPEDLRVGHYIYVYDIQKELIKFIKQSKFKNKLIISEKF